MQSKHLLFKSDFDSGNLDVVEVDDGTLESGEIPHLTARLWTRADGAAAAPTKNKTWFHFSVSLLGHHTNANANESAIVHFKLMNLNRVQKLFSQGMRPVFRVTPTIAAGFNDEDCKWARIPAIPTTVYVDSHMELLFSHPLKAGLTYYFAYCIPFSLARLERKLSNLFSPDPDRSLLQKTYSASKIPFSIKFSAGKRMYLHRDVLCRSVQKRNVDIVTISSTDAILPKFENCETSELFPIQQVVLEKRCKLFDMTKKKFVFISARVHPAETISSFMLDGLMDFLTSDDPKAQLLRSKYVFKIIPILNPDGVYMGHYRGDADGVNLNRVYDSPDMLRFPTIYATKKYIEFLNSISPLDFYIDFHGHANKAGSFLFGNWIPSIKSQYEMLLFARYCHLNNPLFDISECDFAPKEMLPNHNHPSTPLSAEQTKDGTGRVAVYRMTNLTHCYTFEANYFGSKLDRRTILNKAGNTTSISSMNGGSTSTLSSKNPGDHRFTMQDQLMMGRSIGLALFDYSFSCHPFATMQRQDEKMNKWVQDQLRKLYMKARLPYPSLTKDKDVSSTCNL